MEIRKTETFSDWMDTLTDLRGRARIQARIERLAAGHPGDAKPVGGKVSELRIDAGPGCRVYYTQRNRALILLLVGGDKSTQSADIRLAQRIAQNL
ncbi:MAG: type II toxin-antitoxin system RelE/ParE family toxin [Kiritimatiellia bacterium]